MNKKNKIILTLVFTGLLGFTIVEGYVKPELNQKEVQYSEEQKNPFTHDFSRVLPYKNSYMGNASNLSNLNYRLPVFGPLGFTFQLYPDQLKADILLMETAASLDPIKLKQTLLYNSTANFVLIDNLQHITFQFQDRSYTFHRQEVDKWYGPGSDSSSLTWLQDEEEWESAVRGQLADLDQVDRFLDTTGSVEYAAVH